MLAGGSHRQHPSAQADDRPDRRGHRLLDRHDPPSARRERVILNRDIVDSIAAGQEAKMAMLDMPVGNQGRLLKDFSGERFG